MIVQFVNQQSKYSIVAWRELLSGVLPAVLDSTPAGKAFRRNRLETVVTVTFAGPRTMRRINRETRQVDRLTDVLSFPSLECHEGRLMQVPGLADCDPEYPDEPAVILGDIVISLDRAFSQATDYGHSQAREVAFLAVHGLLHILGYDHLEPDQEKIMLRKQKNILSKLGLERGNQDE